MRKRRIGTAKFFTLLLLLYHTSAKAYGTKEIRTYLHDQSASYTIPPKVNTKQPWLFDKETYKRRNVIERFFNRLKEFRRAETRYDKRDDSFLALLWSPRSASLSAFCTAKRCFQIHPNAETSG